MTRSVLLTGATGFVGRQIWRILGELGVPDRVVVRPGRKDPGVALGTAGEVVSTRDLFAESEEWWAEVCKGIDTVIHVAWYAEPGQYLHSAGNIDCLMGTLRLAKGAGRAKVRRFVGIGTCFEYDLAGGWVAVETPLRPKTPYAGAKAAAFMALSQWLPAQGVEFAWCRLFYLYGEGEDPRRLVPYLHAKLSAGQPAQLTSGTQVRDYLDVRVAAQRIVEASLGPARGALNVCSGVATTVRALAEKIADEYGRRDLLRFGARPEDPLDPPCVVGIPCQGSS